MTVANQESNSRTEVNFRRLLYRCEMMAKETQGNYEWRFEKYVLHLVELLGQLKKITTNQPRHEDLIDYARRVELLKGLIEIEKLPSTRLKAIAVEQLVPSRNHDNADANDLNDSKVPKATLSHQLHIKSKSKCLQEMKADLLGTKSLSTLASLRQRQLPASIRVTSADGDDDAVLKHHENLQAKLTEEMTGFARNLKENASISGRVVRTDTEQLLTSDGLADDNVSKLKVECDSLDAKHQER
ncbi:hypothetical protein HELRODRAFT_185094, partial [Helobdella robusta]|uniref:Vesicle transport protein USE1 n=1 Tax=Helobdella robusta TaxID=6412 RepID=T1FME0_HELRO